MQIIRRNMVGANLFHTTLHLRT